MCWQQNKGLHTAGNTRQTDKRPTHCWQRETCNRTRDPNTVGNVRKIYIRTRDSDTAGNIRETCNRTRDPNTVGNVRKIYIRTRDPDTAGNIRETCHKGSKYCWQHKGKPATRDPNTAGNL